MARSKGHWLFLSFVAVLATGVTACASLIGADFDRSANGDAAADDGAANGDSTAADGAASADAATGDGSAATDGSTSSDAGADASNCIGDLCVVASTTSASLAPIAITIAGGSLFFTARSADADAATGQVIRVDLAGGGQHTIVTGLRAPQEIVVGGGYVYFVSHDSPQKVDGFGSIGQVLPDGGARAIAVQGIDDSVFGLALYEGNLVWAAQNPGLVYEQLSVAGTIHLMSSTYLIGGVSADAYGVYVSSSDYSLDSTPAVANVIDIGGGGQDTRQTTLYSYVDPTYLGAVATDTANLIYVDVGGGTINVTDKKYGGAPKVVASNQDSPSGVAADGAGHVYFVTEGTADAGYGDGTVMRTTVDGGAAVPIATAQKHPVSIALDATRVYWANAGDGTIMSAPR
jgi:hypothetical protein